MTAPLKPQETTNYELLGKDWATRAPVRANTADRAPYMLMTHKYVRVHVCTVSIQWNIQTNPDQSSETTSSNTNVTAPVKPQEMTNYELLGK